MTIREYLEFRASEFQWKYKGFELKDSCNFGSIKLPIYDPPFTFDVRDTVEAIG